jgi:hypothetical protein
MTEQAIQLASNLLKRCCRTNVFVSQVMRQQPEVTFALAMISRLSAQAIVITVKVAVRLFPTHHGVAQTSVCPRESAIRHKKATITYFASNALNTR